MEKLLVVKEFEFEAAHFLHGYDGPCANTHGHSYRLQVGFSGNLFGPSGMVFDFSKMKSIIQSEIIDKLDHKLLNCIKDIELQFPFARPTAEEMVIWIRDRLRLALSKRDDNVELALVRLWETRTSYAEWKAE